MSAAALVTGASSGLGRALAVELGRAGRHVVLLARDGQRLAAAARDVEAAGGMATVATADVRDGAALRRAIDAALGGTPLDLAVHAAGVLVLREVASLADDDLRRCFEVNLLGTHHAVVATLPRLAATRGRLVLVSSVAAQVGLPGGFGAYAASKWGVRGYAETVRAELAARGVALTIAYPSIVDTPMVRELAPLPPVYAAFTWHPPERAARAILADAARGRREAFVTWTDRLGAALARAAPATIAAAFAAVVRRAERRRRT